MTTDQWPTLIIAIGSFLATIGYGIKWILSHVETKISAISKKEEAARELFQGLLQAEIKDQDKKIEIMGVEKALYLRRIYQLEHFIHAIPGIFIPEMKGWPPE